VAAEHDLLNMAGSLFMTAFDRNSKQGFWTYHIYSIKQTRRSFDYLIEVLERLGTPKALIDLRKWRAQRDEM